MYKTKNKSRQDLSLARKIHTELVAMENNKLMKAEYGVRILSVFFAVMASLLVGLDTETETTMMITKKATVKDLDALWYVHPCMHACIRTCIHVTICWI